MPSEEEEYHDPSSFEDSEEEEEEDDNFMGSDPDEDSCSQDAVDYSVLSSKDVRSRVDEDISEISTLLSVPAHAARLLLCKYGWNVSRVHEDWFSDEEKTRESCGLIASASASADDCKAGEYSEKGEFFCGICLEWYGKDAKDHRRVAAACGHAFCKTCWRTYISCSIKDGPGSLSLVCPQPSCRVSVADMVDAIVCDEDRARYENFVLRSYVESRKNIKWCPSPGCEYAVECLGGSWNSDVTCKCSYGFCWNCGEETHTPADCSTVAKWVLKNNSEADNTSWMLANTKPCPKCHKSIEKSKGCMHMVCLPPCEFEFCWLCLGPWSEHNKKTGGYYNCNHYEEKRQAGFKEEEQVREMAKNHVVKYTHYFERFIGNHNSRVKAMKNLEELSNTHIQKLSDMHMMTVSQLQFTVDAWNQIVESRRVLKWSYAIGYYLPEDEPAKKQFFEYLQGEAESNLEKLHDLLENGLSEHIKEAEAKLKGDEETADLERFDLDEVFKHTRDADDLAKFNTFRAHVVDLTKVTRTYFDNLVTSLAKGLEDVAAP